MVEKKEFSKEEIKVAQGIAIILMIIHHTFSNKFGMAAKICVAMFAFISGYGLSKRSRITQYESKNAYLKQSYKYVFRKIFLFLSIYWVCLFIFFVPISYYKGLSISQWIMLILTLNKQINGGLWYVTQYVWMLLLFPCVWGIVNYSYCNEDIDDKRKKMWFLVEIIISLFLFFIVYVVVRKCSFIYLIIFFEGMLFERYKIFDKEIYLSSGIINFLMGILTVSIRYMLTRNASDCWMDIFLVGGVVYFGGKICRKMKFVQKLGELSAWMWFLHTWIYAIWGKHLARMNNVFLVTVMLVGCFVASKVLDYWWKQGISLLMGWKRNKDVKEC